MGLSAPATDRPYFEFSSSFERTTKRVMQGAGVGPATSSHQACIKMLVIGEYRGIRSSLDAVVHY